MRAKWTKLNIREGSTYGRLTVIRRDSAKKRPGSWICQCVCGKEASVIGHDLFHGYTVSCGCYRRDRATTEHSTHGFARKDRVTKVYRSWSSMWSRCRNKKDPSYQRYGGRGITVCDRWKSFENFLADMGDRPEGKTIDRINNDLGYSPENCKWSTASEQALNRRPRHLWAKEGGK